MAGLSLAARGRQASGDKSVDRRGWASGGCEGTLLFRKQVVEARGTTAQGSPTPAFLGEKEQEFRDTHCGGCG